MHMGFEFRGVHETATIRLSYRPLRLLIRQRIRIGSAYGAEHGFEKRLTAEVYLEPKLRCESVKNEPEGFTHGNQPIGKRRGM